MSNVGRWAPWYSTMTPADAAAMYGQDSGKVFALAADFLDGLAVEDWGCGFATFRSFHRGPFGDAHRLRREVALLREALAALDVRNDELRRALARHERPTAGAATWAPEPEEAS